MPADLIIYAIVAAGLVFWLRGTLGTRQEGDEPAKPPMPLPDIDAKAPAHDAPANAKAAVMPAPEDQLLDLIKDKSGAIGIDKAAEEGVLEIIQADKTIDLKFFMTAAQDAFVYVVEAFADGDRETLKDMLAPPVYKAFDAAITAREEAGETAETEIHAFHETRIIEAALNGKTAKITLRFVADETGVTRDKDGTILSGHPEKTSRMTDIWTFSRTLKSRDPRWLVSETRGDFNDDNDVIPNAE